MWLPEHVRRLAEKTQLVIQAGRALMTRQNVAESLREIADDDEIWQDYDLLKANAERQDEDLLSNADFMAREIELLVQHGADPQMASLIALIVVGASEAPMDFSELPTSQQVREGVRSLADTLSRLDPTTSQYSAALANGILVLGGLAVLTIDGYAMLHAQLAATASLGPALKAMERGTKPYRR